MQTPRTICHALLLCGVATLSIPNATVAQIYECSAGVWQNKPCEDTHRRSIAEEPSDPRLSDPEYLSKRDTIHLAYVFQRKIREQHVDFNPKYFEAACEDPKVTADQCTQMLHILQLQGHEKAKQIAERLDRERLLQEVSEAKIAAERAATEALWGRLAAEDAADNTSALQQSLNGVQAELRDLKD